MCRTAEDQPWAARAGQQAYADTTYDSLVGESRQRDSQHEYTARHTTGQR